MPRVQLIRQRISSSSPVVPKSERTALRSTDRAFDQGTIDNALKKCFRKLHQCLPTDFPQVCQHADHDGTCVGVVYMYHGGNSTLLGDAEERTPVCDPSHPNYCYLGTFFIWCKTYGVWGGWLSEPLLTLEQLQDDDVQMWLQQRQLSSSARRKYRSPPHPPSSQPRKGVKDESGSRQTALSNDFIEIISSDDDHQLDSEKEPVMVLFWQKDNRSPALLRADGPPNCIEDILGLFDQQRVYQLYIPETLSWAVVHPQTQVVVYQGSCIALKCIQVEDLSQWDTHVGKLSDILLDVWYVWFIHLHFEMINTNSRRSKALDSPEMMYMAQRKGLFLPFAFVMASSGQQALDARHRSKRKAGKAAEQTTYGDTIEFIEGTSEGLSRSIFQVPFVPDPVAKEEYERRKQREIELAEREQIEAEAGEKDQTEKKRTQASNRQFLEEYRRDADLLTACDMALNTDATLGQTCCCGKGQIEVQCEDCPGYRATCRQCWIKKHSRYTWWHWALVWNREGDFFQRYDFSRVLEPAPVIQLGHHGDSCPNPTTPILLIHIHVNGIHTSCFGFCRCKALPEGLPYKEEVRHIRWTQLMQARLFPASAKRAGTAFSYPADENVSTTASRGENNVFPYDIPDASKQLRRAFHVWNLMKTQSRLGQSHGIDDVLTRRPPGNLVVWCTACPVPGFNMERGWETTSKRFMHLNQLNLGLDGNFHLNKLKKKPESDDVSLFQGRAYYPEEEKYKEYLRVTPSSAEKSVCNNLKVVNTQNKRKFKTMEVTGVVNCACNHVCVFGTVDLHLGEQFRNTDAALLQALRLRMHGQEKSDLAIMLSYDCNCAYNKNLSVCFQGVAFDGVRACLETMRYMIPDLHVQGHQDDCIYLYGSGYFECNGHNHGEGIEQYWALINALGAQIRQMNNGYRQDTLIIHHGDHNWKKTYTQGYRLVIETADAKYMYRKKRDFYDSHSARCKEQYPEAFEEWQKVDRYHTFKDGEDIVSPYRFRSKQFPSLKSVITKMATIATATDELLKKKEELSLRKDEELSAADEKDEGNKSMPSARELLTRIRNEKTNPNETERDAIDREREKLGTRIFQWYREAPNPEIADMWDKVFEMSAPVPETCKLLLPSAMSHALRQKMAFTDLVMEEYKLREGAAYDAIAEVRLRASTVAYMDETRQRDVKGQRHLTRSLRQLNDARNRLELGIQHYNAHRTAMKELGVHDGSSFPLPELSMQDTYRKTRTRKRAMGDSRKMDGRIFGNVTKGSTLGKGAGSSERQTAEFVGTQITRKKAHVVRKKKTQADSAKREDESSSNARREKSTAKKMKTSEDPPEDAATTEEGWIWNLYKIRHPGMTDEEVEALEQEGDRVSFFRAEAERDRWLEQWEIKIAEFLRCIRSFDQYAVTWKVLASNNESIGFKQYALEKANMYAMLGARARQEFETLGYGNALNRPAEQTLEDFMIAQ
ncbi:uncharacterized protein ARMOST_22265 [Armillaria ostoyae]|uniref:CxC2-like cysteine cluster KDZ transposase-associated domain-containing protein n=1 Tax=Armillaria ostoyae TaxID=47428 RepID=A0A284SCE3_ARMOS|nr:uncharacterized protein ARMOST_22265 [Armillaria ostoyae]